VSIHISVPSFLLQLNAVPVFLWKYQQLCSKNRNIIFAFLHTCLYTKHNVVLSNTNWRIHTQTQTTLLCEMVVLQNKKIVLRYSAHIKPHKRLQEAQLPLRSNAFLCSEVTFYRRNDLHQRLSPPKPTSDNSANLLRTQRINFSMRPQHVRMTRDTTVVWCLLSTEPLRIPA